MGLSIGVAIGTFGDEERWTQQAEIAAKTARHQTRAADAVVHVHAHTLSEARNLASKALGTHWQIFLDADDGLDPNYIDDMYNVVVRNHEETGPAIWRPWTIGFYPDGTWDDEACLIEESNLMERNCAVVGAMHRRQDFEAVGGFADLPCLEDWDLWTRMHYELKLPLLVSPAVYQVGVYEESRNKGERLHGEIYRQLKRRNRTEYGKV